MPRDVTILCLLEEIKQINLGGGNGSIIGRNTFQRPKEDAINFLKKELTGQLQRNFTLNLK